MRSIPGCTEPKTYGEARSQLEDALKMLAEANSLLLWWRYGKSMTLKQCAHLNDKTDIALGRFGLSEADIDRGMSASAETVSENKGIKNHDGRCKAAEQKLLVQHILDNDKGLSESSRMILEKLIEE